MPTKNTDLTIFLAIVVWWACLQAIPLPGYSAPLASLTDKYVTISKRQRLYMTFSPTVTGCIAKYIITRQVCICFILFGTFAKY